NPPSKTLPGAKAPAKYILTSRGKIWFFTLVEGGVSVPKIVLGLPTVVWRGTSPNGVRILKFSVYDWSGGIIGWKIAGKPEVAYLAGRSQFVVVLRRICFGNIYLSIIKRF